MQWFAFVLLISFSACFAQQSAPTGNKTANDNNIPISNKVPPITDTSVTGTNNPKKSVNSDDPVINGGTITDASITEINVEPPITSSTPNTTTFAPNSTTASPKPTSPPTSTPTTTPKSTTTTKTTTKPTSTLNPTVVPVTTTTVPHLDRKFDGPSFVGGIILALGLVAIGFVAFKFYKARTEMNYHTL
ncbi:sialomucin core protein 24-like isoform X2 [Euwallacea similis]|uniref:sialomucin core protein 24-like isoform X2 n=1 Tax=Euwallacea similis TaxID=1736056 RepID=UPI00344D5ED3